MAIARRVHRMVAVFAGSGDSDILCGEFGIVTNLNNENTGA
jgi:hypothetical protein